MRKFCYKCGKKTENLIEGLCRNCVKEKNKSFYLEVAYCPKCHRVKDGKLWREVQIENFIKKRLKAKKIDFDKKIAFTSKGEINFSFSIKKEICIHCSRLSSGYYESVVQLRNFSEEELDKLPIRYLHFVKLTKHGPNIHFIKKSDANSFVRKIKRIFKNVRIKKSYKLVTVKDGKRVYRNYISVRKNEKD